jgi:diguanylate cyclase (GGDEF)-like protein
MLWRVYLAVGALLVAAYYLLPGGLPRDILYVALGSSCAVAIVLGVRMYNPERRLAWYLMAVGQLSWVMGDALDSWYVDVRGVVVYPSPADVLYLAAYPLLADALLLLIRRRRSSRDLAGLLDSAIVTAGLGVLSWVLLARPTVDTSGPLAASAVSLAYPVADILLVGLLVRLVTTPGGRTTSFRLLLTAVSLLVMGDTASGAVNLVSSGSSNFDFLWLCSYLLWGAAALHPSMRSLSEPGPITGPLFSKARLAVLTIATLMAPGTLAVQLAVHSRVDGWPIVVGSFVLFLLVVARMNLAIHQIVTTNRQREQLQDDLTFQATHDSLTELPNRAQAMKLIEGALHRAQRSGAIVGLLFVDLDGFKMVNDKFGHSAGDVVLRVAARRMQHEVRIGDVVARLGGDEFLVLLEPVESESAGVDIAKRLIDVLSAEVSIAWQRDVIVGASIGAAFSLDGDTDPERLLGEADAAVYRAKAMGRGRVEVYDESLRRELYDRAHFDTAVVDGLSNGEFVLHYQPVVDVRTHRIQGYEALIRWNRPGIGLLAPDQFIPMAEESALISDIGRWVLTEALTQLADWTAADPAAYRDVSMAVNISGRHISDPCIIEDVARALQTSGVAATQLTVEITETVLIDEPMAIRHLHVLRGTGVSISIDDFGTGYNSIVQLAHLPVDGIKIDRSFLSSTHPAAGRLLVLIVQAAHAFGLPVIAEGVENVEQLQALERVDCESAQGFLFSRPMPAPAAEEFLRSHHGTAELNPAPIS